MVHTLREAIESTEDRQHRARLKKVVDRVNHHATGDIGKAVIKTRQEMGKSLGRCYFANNEIHFNEILLQEGNEKQLEATGHHEKEHANGNHLEGLTERRAIKLAGLSRPTGLLVDQVEAANDIVGYLGEEKTYELARQGQKGPIALEQALVQKFVGGLLNWVSQWTSDASNQEQKMAEAQKKARTLVARAKDYKKAA